MKLGVEEVIRECELMGLYVEDNWLTGNTETGEFPFLQ